VVCHAEAEDIFSRGRQKMKVEAGSVFCYWAAAFRRSAIRLIAVKKLLKNRGANF